MGEGPNMKSVSFNPGIAQVFRRLHPQEDGAASGFCRCEFVEEYEPNEYHLCKLAEGHPGEHDFGKQTVSVEIFLPTDTSTTVQGKPG